MNGKYIEDYSVLKIRSIISLSKFHPYLQNAFIAIEDERFRQHHGIDLKEYSEHYG